MWETSEYKQPEAFFYTIKGEYRYSGRESIVGTILSDVRLYEDQVSEVVTASIRNGWYNISMHRSSYPEGSKRDE
jgi:hypothetical protein